MKTTTAGFADHRAHCERGSVIGPLEGQRELARQGPCLNGAQNPAKQKEDSSFKVRNRPSSL